MKHPAPDIPESEIHRLIRDAWPPEARPHPVLRQQIFDRLSESLPPRTVPDDFPIPVLGSFAFLGILLLLILSVFWGLKGPGFLQDSPWMILFLLLLVNFISLPVSGFLIVYERRFRHV